MKPKGAIFYKSALQVNSYRYNHDYRGGEHFDEDDYNRYLKLVVFIFQALMTLRTKQDY